MITSKDNKKIKEFNKLKLAKYRKKNNSFLVCNDKIIEEGFNTDRIKKIITCDSQYIFDDVILVSKEIIDYLSNGEASKYIGVCEYFNGYYPKGDKVLILNNIQDPGNMGTILRNAKAFGYNDVVISHDCVDIYNEKVLKSSMGVIFYLNIYSCNVYQYLLDDKRSIITTFLDEPNNAPVVLKHNLVLGNEGHGIDLEIKDLKHSNYVIDIEFESLNVAVASGIIMNELRR